MARVAAALIINPGKGLYGFRLAQFVRIRLFFRREKNPTSLTRARLTPPCLSAPLLFPPNQIRTHTTPTQSNAREVAHLGWSKSGLGRREQYFAYPTCPTYQPH